MTGHAPGVVVEAASQRLKDGYTFMLPVEDAFWVTEELTHRFGLPYWQMVFHPFCSINFNVLSRQ